MMSGPVRHESVTCCHLGSCLSPRYELVARDLLIGFGLSAYP